MNNVQPILTRFLSDEIQRRHPTRDDSIVSPQDCERTVRIRYSSPGYFRPLCHHQAMKSTESTSVAFHDFVDIISYALKGLVVKLLF